MIIALYSNYYARHIMANFTVPVFWEKFSETCIVYCCASSFYELAVKTGSIALQKFLCVFHGLAVKTGTIVLQKFLCFLFVFILFILFSRKKLFFWGRNFVFQIRLKKQM